MQENCKQKQKNRGIWNHVWSTMSKMNVGDVEPMPYKEIKVVKVATCTYNKRNNRKIITRSNTDNKELIIIRMS